MLPLSELRRSAHLAFLFTAIMLTGCRPTAQSGAGIENRERPTVAASASTLKIATFNIENLGRAKLQKPSVVAVLVDIIHKYDLVAVQEIADSSLATPGRLLAEIDRVPSGHRYDVLASQRSGQQAADKTSQEQYAIYYDVQTLRVLDAGGLFPDDGENLFRREPFAAEFQTTDGKLTFVVITVHTDPDVAPREIAALGKAYTWAKARFPRSGSIVLMGDFNAGVAYTKPAQIAAIRSRDLPYLWIVPDNADTTLAAKPEAHDRIIVDGALATLFTSRWGVDRAFQDESVSDHWPVWAEFAKPENK